MRKLELKDIAGYLPYGLKAIHEREKKIKEICIYAYSPMKLALSWVLDTDYSRMAYRVLLRPMLDLYKPCLPDGKIPIVELAKIANDDIEEYLDPKITESYGSYHVEFKKWHGKYEGCTDLLFNPNNMYFARYVDGEGWEGIPNIYRLFDFLFENHFDIHNLIESGLAIDINTVEI